MSLSTAPTPDVFRVLQRAMEANPPPVVIVVGAGVSFGATRAAHAKWLGLLEHGLWYLRDSKRIDKDFCATLLKDLKSAFSSFDLAKVLEYADIIQNLLKLPDEETLRAWLESAFGDFEPQAGCTDTLDALLQLQQTGALLLTTNYDTLLADLTDLPAVTPIDKDDFYRVATRQTKGILHIHGHWRKPASVVLGARSYDNIVRDESFQQAFRYLWMHNHWLYVGCGNGLEDPNLGRMLEWGKQWGNVPREHLYLGLDQDARRIGESADKPPNLTCIGLPDFDAIAPALSSLLPANRILPFERIKAGCSLVRPADKAQADDPFPSWQEYLDGEVPALDADTEVSKRLRTHSWAFVLDLASVGKTTLALRMATTVEQRERATYYIDLAKNGDNGYDEGDVLKAAKLLSRQEVLLIVDNAQHAPALVYMLWTQWRDHPRDSRLLLIATASERAVITDAVQDLGHFHSHTDNPPIPLQPGPADLMRIMHSLFRRLWTGRSQLRLPMPPEDALMRWHRDYGHALGAFCIAVLSRRAELLAGRWSLPQEAAAGWVLKKWLKPLNERSRANALCLAAFGAQELEMTAPAQALPYPADIEQLLEKGLISRSEHGAMRQYTRYQLRDPSWGQLLLAAHLSDKHRDIDVGAFSEDLLIEAAPRSLSTAGLMSFRWRRAGNTKAAARIWKDLAERKFEITIEMFPDSLFPVSSILMEIEHSGQASLSAAAWSALEREPRELMRMAFATSLEKNIHFLKIARQLGRTVVCDLIWKGFRDEPDRLADKAFVASLDNLWYFLEAARLQEQAEVCGNLWRALEEAPKAAERLADNAFSISLDKVAFFLRSTRQGGRGTVCKRLWKSLEDAPDRLAKSAFDTPLEKLAHFLDAARDSEQPVLCDTLWKRMIAIPEVLTDTALSQTLAQVAHFLVVAKRHRRTDVCNTLWESLESVPDRLTKAALTTQLSDLAHFLVIAERHGQSQLLERLWTSLEKKQEKLAVSALTTPIGDLARFLDVAKEHGRESACHQLWDALESRPEKLIESVLAPPLNDIARFLEACRKYERTLCLERLWLGFETNIDTLVAKIEESETQVVAYFFDVVRRHGRDPLPENDADADSGLECAPAPQALTCRILERIPPEHWAKVGTRGLMLRTGMLVMHCRRVGQQRHVESILSVITERAEPKDFPHLYSGFSEAAWLLKLLRETQSHRIGKLLDALCTNHWLGNQYQHAKLGFLAGGLRQLAMHQPVDVVRRFHNSGLLQRMEREFLGFDVALAERKSQCVQLLGCVSLCGFPIPVSLFVNTGYRRLALLPESALPHREDAPHVEEWQYQLWLGLRAVVALKKRPLRLAPGLIRQTRDLWRFNLERSVTAPLGAEHRVDQQMVAWLDDCLRRGECDLISPNRFFLLPELAGPKPG